MNIFTDIWNQHMAECHCQHMCQVSQYETRHKRETHCHEYHSALLRFMGKRGVSALHFFPLFITVTNFFLLNIQTFHWPITRSHMCCCPILHVLLMAATDGHVGYTRCYVVPRRVLRVTQLSRIHVVLMVHFEMISVCRVKTENSHQGLMWQCDK